MKRTTKKPTPKRSAARRPAPPPSPLTLASGDCYLPIPALSAYSGYGKKTLRVFTQDPVDPLPCHRNGAPGRPGRRGPKILVLKSDFDAWMARRRQRAREAPRDVGAILQQAKAEVLGR